MRGRQKMEEVEVGSLYEIDHYMLPLNSPLQLNQIRVAMVIEKNDQKVSLLFPSESSLKPHLSHGRTRNTTKKMIPSLDEEYTLDLSLAGDVLHRKIPTDEWCKHRYSWSFWVLNTEIDEEVEKIEFDIKAKDEEDGEEEDEHEEEKLEPQHPRKSRKRKCKKPHNRILTTLKKENRSVSYNNKKQKVVKTAINRWSEDRLELAEESMLKVLKAKGAVAGKPILRLDLRQEARKWIRDTGLLDHMLKHMAGKVTPGGAERFRRRHNPEGVMEYWLESADLVEIRKKAGVQDPYWIPPPGWKTGENPNWDSVLAKELGEIEEKITEMQRDMDEMKSKNDKGKQAIVVATPSSRVVNPNIEDNSSSFLAAKKMYMELVKRNGELEEQIIKLSDSLKEVERETLNLKSSESVKQAAAAQNKDSVDKVSESTLTATSIGTEKENKHGNKAYTTIVQRRLKSGFTVCRPPGTFLWPDMPSPPISSTTTTTNTASLPLSHRPPIKVKLVNNDASRCFLDLNSAPSEHR